MRLKAGRRPRGIAPIRLELQGARLDLDSYVQNRRAIRLIAENSIMAITLKPAVRCVNPVFELVGASKNLASVTLGQQTLTPKDYAWDGQTLWIRADIDDSTILRLEFK